MTGNTNNQIFDNYEVNCNECSNYWNDTCSGVPINKKRNCTSFTATKASDIPKQIQQLKRDVVYAKVMIVILCLINVIEVVL